MTYTNSWSDRQAPLGTAVERPASASMIATKLRRINKGALVGFFDLRITGWHLALYDCKWFVKGDNEWIGLPSVKYTTKEGTPAYKDLIEFTDKEAAARFQVAALNAVWKIDT